MARNVTQLPGEARRMPPDQTSIGDTPTEALASAMEKLDWPSVRRILDDALASQSLNWRQKSQICANATDWVGVLRAEPSVLAETKLAGTEDLPPPLMRHAIQARQRLELFEEARDLSRIMRDRLPDRPEWKRREADALFNLGDHQAALTIAMEAWKARLDFAPQLVVRNLIAMDDLHTCKLFLEEVATTLDGDASIEATRARLDYLEATSDHGAISGLVETIRGRAPDHEYWSTRADIAGRMLNLDALAEMLVMLGEWERGEAFDAVFRRAGPTILQAHFKSFADWPKVSPLIKSLAQRPLEAGPAATLAAILLQAGDYQGADAVVRRSLDFFPSSLALWRRRLHILSLIGVTENLNATRARMKEQFPRESYLAAASIAEPRSWDDSEIPDLLAHNISGKNKSRQAKFFASLTEADLTESQLQSLRSVAVNGPPTIATQFDLMLAAAKDARMLEQAVTAPVNFWQFRKTQGEVAEHVRRLTADMPMDEPGRPPAKFGMADCLRLTEGIQKRDRSPYLYTRESYADAARVAAVLIRRIRQKLPSSVIRLGDGEGHFMEGPQAVSHYRDADRAQIQNIWWGSTRMRGAQLDKIVADFHAAVERSDLLAILPPWRFIAEMQKPDYTPVHRGIHSSIHHVANINYDGLIVSMHFPNDLHKWGLWDEIFDACDQISYVSCHELGPVLLDHFGVQTRLAIQIPGERQFTALFDPASEQNADDRVLLHRHEEIIDSLRPQRGEVFLVAAGFLGKIYCHIIKKRGGIGIDIGSLADYWMGFATRRYRLEDENDTGVLTVHIDDHVLKDQADPNRIIGRSGPIKSSGNGRYNIAGLATAAAMESDPAPATPPRLVRAIGHPGCAGGYLAATFCLGNAEVGHHKVMRDGIVSWTHAVCDQRTPHEEDTTSTQFTHTIAYVRDPADAVPSIMIENAQAKSLYFRRQHILRKCGVDLADYTSALDRAVASLTFWYEIVFSKDVEQILQVERASVTIADLLARWGHRGAAHRQSPIAVLDPPEDAPRLSTPILTRETYRGLSAELKTKLERYCEISGYELPW